MDELRMVEAVERAIAASAQTVAKLYRRPRSARELALNDLEALIRLRANLLLSGALGCRAES